MKKSYRHSAVKLVSKCHTGKNTKQTTCPQSGFSSFKKQKIGSESAPKSVSLAGYSWHKLLEFTIKLTVFTNLQVISPAPFMIDRFFLTKPDVELLYQNWSNSHFCSQYNYRIAYLFRLLFKSLQSTMQSCFLSAHMVLSRFWKTQRAWIINGLCLLKPVQTAKHCKNKLYLIYWHGAESIALVKSRARGTQSI